MKLVTFLIAISCVLSCKKNNVGTYSKNITKKSLDDTLFKKRFPNNKLEYIILRRYILESNELHISYYKYGNIKEKGLQGIVSNKDINTKSPIQTCFYYDELKNL